MLTHQNIYDLGRAWGSFSVGEIDQGVHIVLPVIDVGTGQEENAVFEPLCKMLDKIPRTWKGNEAFMGAVEQFALDQGLEVETYWTEAYQDAIK